MQDIENSAFNAAGPDRLPVDRSSVRSRTRRAVTSWMVAWAMMVGASGCEQGEFTSARITISYEHSEVDLFIFGNKEPPCPELELDARFTVNGEPLVFHSRGGEARDPDIRYGVCDEVWTQFAAVDLSDGQLILVGESREWPMRIEASPAPRFELWSDDDVSAAVADGQPFEVQWQPAEATVPSLSLYIDSQKQDVIIEEISRGTGRATFRILDAPPASSYVVIASSRYEAPITVCEGVPECIVSASRYMNVNPPESPRYRSISPDPSDL